MSRTGKPLDPEPEVVAAPRLFLREAGWQVALKVGSAREFCFVIAPGEESYHRLADGEIYLHRADERLCLPCAGRLGLLAMEPKGLREGLDPLDQIEPAGVVVEEYEVGPPRA